MKRKSPRLLSLCDYSGIWSQPYVDAGYQVVRVDSGYPSGPHVTSGVQCVGQDVCLYQPSVVFDAVLAAPPCTCFCRPAARWWKQQDAEGRTEGNIEIMRACLRLCAMASRWWALENPPGRHQSLILELGPPAWQFHPWEYGDPWCKQTYIWGTASKPITSPVAPLPATRTPNGKLQGRIARMSSSHQRQREETPRGFAKAFAKANPL